MSPAPTTVSVDDRASTIARANNFLKSTESTCEKVKESLSAHPGDKVLAQSVFDLEDLCKDASGISSYLSEASKLPDGTIDRKNTL
jgi:hypothetical protein